MLAAPRHQVAAAEGGWALISVLGVLLILSVLAAAMVSLSVTSRRIAITERSALESQSIAESAIARAVVALLDPRVDARWRVDGVPRKFALAGAEVEVTIQDELGKIDLNAADGAMLAALLEKVGGLDKDSSRDLADKIMDWRESDDLRHLHGATRADYLVAGFPYAPRSGPFQSISELRLVMDMSDVVFARVAPALTVFTGRPNFDPQTAPREVLLTMPNADEVSVDRAVSERAGDQRQAVGPSVFARPGVIDPSIPLGGRSFTVSVSFTHKGRHHASSVTVMLTGDPRRPYLAQAWRIE